MNPSVRNKSYSIAGKAAQDTEAVYIKTLSMFGLTSSISLKVNNSDDGNLHITPCVYAPNGSTGYIYLDYNITSIIGDAVVETFFDLLSAGTTLTIEDANYNYDESSVNGSYTFVELVNSIVTLTGVTVEELNEPSFKYYPEKFDTNPRILLGSTINVALPVNQLNIENVFTRGINSFIAHGVTLNDVLEHGEFKLKVIGISQSHSTGYENILVDITGITHTDIDFTFNDPVLLNLYR